MYRHPLHTTLSDSVPALGLQIQAVALSYAAHAAKNNWIEQTSNNTDEFIKTLWACYAPGRKLDTTSAGSYNNAYCAVGVSVIVSDAVDCFRRAGTPGAVNILPGYSETYGNAKTLRDKSRSLANFTDKTPAIGATFYRASSGSSSGHCGIIVGLDYTTSGQLTLVRTVESNASLSGAKTQYGFLVVEYTTSSPFWIGNTSAEWEILHTERMFTAAAPIANCTATCLKITIPVSVVSPASSTTGTTPVKSEGTTSTTRAQRGTPEDSSTNTSVSRAQRETEPISQPCKDTYILRSCCEDGKTTLRPVTDTNLRHYSALREKPVATDYIQLRVSPDKPFRMVTDASGNRFFIAVESVKETWDIPREMGIFGNYIVIPFSRTEAGFTGGDSDNGMAGFLGVYSLRTYQEQLRRNFIAYHGLRASTYTETIGIDKGKQFLYKPTNIPEGTLRDLVEILWSDVSTYGAVMQKIEENSTRRGTPYPNNFVLLFTGEPVSVAKGLANAVEAVAPLVLGALGTAGIQLADSTRTLVTATLPSVLRGQFNLAHAGQLVQLGSSVLPATYQPLADKAQRILTSVSTRQFGAETGADALAILRAVDSELGIGLAGRVDAVFNGIKQQIDAQQLLYANAAAEIRRVANSVKGDVEKTAQVFSNALTSFNLGNLVSVGTAFDDPNWLGKTLFSKIVEASSVIDSLDRAPTIVRDVRLREMILSTSTLQALGAVPGFHAVVKGIMSVPTVYREMIQSTADHYTWAAIALGNRLSDDALLKVQLDALSRKAIEFRDRGWQFSLPSIFEGEKRECISREIELCTGIACCPPKVLVNGVCLDPSEVPPVDTKPVESEPPKNQVNLPPSLLPPVKVAPPVQTPPTVTLPTCIRQEGSGYVYCPPLSCGIPGSSVAGKAALSPVTASSAVSMPSVAPVSVAPVSVSAPTVSSAPVSVAPVSGTVVSSPRVVSAASVSVPTVTAPVVASAPGLVVTPVPVSPVPVSPGSVSAALLNSPAVIAAPKVSPKLSDSSCYPARVVYAGTPMEVWFAQIAGTWIEIIDCCPSGQEDCCSDNKSRISRIEERISKLYELVLRNEAGEKNSSVDFTAIRSEIATLRSYIENLRTSTTGTYDDSGLRLEMRRLESLITQLQRSRTEGQVYNDTEVRSRITTLEGQITKILEEMASLGRSTSTGTSYDDSGLRTELARQAKELEQLHTMRYDGLRNEQETALLQQQIASLQKAVERLQTQSSTVVQTGATTKSVEALASELALIQRNMQTMQQGYEANIALLERERQNASIDPVTGNRTTDNRIYDELAQLKTELNKQVQLYNQKISEKSGEVKSTIRQRYNVSATAPPAMAPPTTVPAVPPSVTGSGSWGGWTNGNYPGNCPDCPALVETHTRIINRYPQHQKTCCN